MGRYFSDELFHFVGRSAPEGHESNYTVLKTILSSGCISHPPHRPGWGETSVHIDWSKTLTTEDLIVPTVVCFCDIPVEHLPLHLRKYGQFGVGLDKTYLIRCGARPVTYIPLHSGNHLSIAGKALLKHFEAVYRGFREQIFDKANLPPSRINVHGAKPTSFLGAVSALDSVLAKDLLAFLKPFSAELSEDHPDYYYAEREWRKFGNQLFTSDHVRSVVVASGFVGRLEEELPQYKGKVETASRR